MRLSLRSAAAVLALTLLTVPDAAQAQGGILGRARRAVERGVDRATERAKQEVEDEADRQTDALLTNAFGEVGDQVSQALGLRSSGSNSTASLESGELVDSNIEFETGTATLTTDSEERLVRMSQQFDILNDPDIRGDIRINLKGYTGSGVSRSLAQERADVARDTIIEAGDLQGSWIRVNSGTASGGDGDLGIQLITPDR